MTTQNVTYNTNVPDFQKGTHRGIELAFKYMGIEREGGKGGVVMNISSTAGITCKPKISYALPAYYASKHAVTSLTRCFGVSIMQYISCRYLFKKHYTTYLIYLIGDIFINLVLNLVLARLLVQ